LGVVIGVFFSVPIIIYGEFQTADADKQLLLRQSLEQQGQIIAEAIRPHLESFEGGSAREIRGTLTRISEQGPNVKLLFRPEANNSESGFYYIAAAPSVPEDYLAAEKEDLRRNGVFGRLGATCAGDRPFAMRYRNPAGQEEILTSITPVTTQAGCWALITSHSASELLGTVLSRPYWATPEVQVAAFIYLMSAVLVIVMFITVWRSISRFAEQARIIRTKAAGRNRTFRSINRIPELGGVAEEFDRMVDSLEDSARAIRHAAEDNAHAFKTPLAIISQSLEPLRRSVAANNERGARAIELIERAMHRLDGLVSASRRMDEATADMLESSSERIDLSALTAEMLDGYAESFNSYDIKVQRSIEPGVMVKGGVEQLETVLENLLDNAIDFAPKGSRIIVVIHRNGQSVDLSVADEGPGVSDEKLEHVFQRYVSDRQEQENDNGLAHSGIGLWLVRRHVEAMGGDVRAANRNPKGLEISISLPALK
jgi:two-component system sensor histidine kinase ChvG